MSERDFKGTRVEVRNGDIDGALRRLKKILIKEDWARDIARSTYYEKPSEIRKRKKAQAKKAWRKKRSQLESQGKLVANRTGLKYLKTTRTRKIEKDRQDRMVDANRRTTNHK
jgi:small subunit ribosomal protein S21